MTWSPQCFSVRATRSTTPMRCARRAAAPGRVQRPDEGHSAEEAAVGARSWSAGSARGGRPWRRNDVVCPPAGGMPRRHRECPAEAVQRTGKKRKVNWSNLAVFDRAEVEQVRRVGGGLGEGSGRGSSTGLVPARFSDILLLLVVCFGPRRTALQAVTLVAASSELPGEPPADRSGGAHLVTPIWPASRHSPCQTPVPPGISKSTVDSFRLRARFLDSEAVRSATFGHVENLFGPTERMTVGRVPGRCLVRRR